MVHLLSRHRHLNSMRHVGHLGLRRRRRRRWTRTSGGHIQEIVLLSGFRPARLTPLVPFLLLRFANVAVLPLFARHRLLLLDDGLDDGVEPSGVLLVAFAPRLPGVAGDPGEFWFGDLTAARKL